MIFVTGANSLLGTHVVKQLLLCGYQVKALVRRAESFCLPGHENLQVLTGKMDDVEFIAHHLPGCQALIHIAACTAQDITDYSYYVRVNIHATQMLLEQSVRHQLKKFVYVSTANCFGFGTKETPGNETLPPHEPFTNSFYACSKYYAQQNVLKFKDKIDVIVVNPTFMLGAYDAKPSSGQIILMGYRKKIIFYPPGGKNFINAADVAQGVLNAMERGRTGEAYLLAGENMSYRDFFEKLSVETAHKPVYVKVPKGCLLLVGYMGNFLRRLNIKNRFTLENMQMLCIENYYSNSKAVRHLNFEVTPLEEGINEAIEWFRQENMI